MIDADLTFSDDMLADVPDVVWAYPEVQLIAHTRFYPPVGEDNLVLLTADPRGDDGENLAEFAGRSCYESYERPNPATADLDTYLAHVLEVQHLSVIEHAQATFYITGVSRSLTHELVRHRHFSYSQLSQRYVDSKDVRFVMPPAYRGEGKLGRRDRQLAAAGFARMTYDKNVRSDISDGVPRKKAREAARSTLPNMTETRITLTGNYRSWIEFLIKRDNPAADVEIQRLARTIGDALADLAPNIFGPDARAKWDTTAAQAATKH